MIQSTHSDEGTNRDHRLRTASSALAHRALPPESPLIHSHDQHRGRPACNGGAFVRAKRLLQIGVHDRRNVVRSNHTSDEWKPAMIRTEPLDFVNDTDHDDDATALAQWASLYLSVGVTAELATPSAYGRWATFRLVAASSRVLHDALLTYFGGDNASALESLRDAQVDA